MLHCTDIGTLLPCDFGASSFPITFTSYINKSCESILVSHEKLKTLSSYLKFHTDLFENNKETH